MGILHLEDMKAVARTDWGKTKISDVMRPVKSEYFVPTGTFIRDAQEQMRANGIGAVGVIDISGNLVGFLHGGRVKKLHVSKI